TLEGVEEVVICREVVGHRTAALHLRRSGRRERIVRRARWPAAQVRDVFLTEWCSRSGQAPIQLALCLPTHGHISALLWELPSARCCAAHRKQAMPIIALVDDDHNILTSVSMALEAEGYSDGASALKGFKPSPPDLAILDMKMPGMDGMELLRRLRQNSDM